jgi:hypothetical protein
LKLIDPNCHNELLTRRGAILARVEELFFVSNDHIEEEQILDDALYALHALRNCALSETSAA